jgi:uncharacterized protein YlxW (UPF0749 family)
MEQDGSTRGRRPRRLATAGVVAVFGVAGLLFATSAETARGTQLRTDRTDLAAVIRAENAKHDEITRRLAQIRSDIDAQEEAEAGVNSEVAALRRQASAVAPGAGLAPVTGRGMVVTLDDAPRTGTRPSDASPDDLVVHQQDVQAVVNAMWAGGAEAMMLMDQRVISTSAVRCVGNTLILQGRVYSPPFTIAAIGDPARMRKAMDESPAVPVYLQYVQRYGLGWKVEEKNLAMPAFGGSLELRYATVATPDAPASATSSATPSRSSSGSSAGLSAGSSGGTPGDAVTASDAATAQP